jgi:hypothetical protein
MIKGWSKQEGASRLIQDMYVKKEYTAFTIKPIKNVIPKEA